MLLLNTSFCSYFNRTGLICGDCEEGHSPFVLSYNLSCVRCPEGHKNCWKFILVAFGPLTFFYFFVVPFNINVTSPVFMELFGSVKLRVLLLWFVWQCLHFPGASNIGKIHFLQLMEPWLPLFCYSWYLSQCINSSGSSSGVHTSTLSFFC